MFKKELNINSKKSTEVMVSDHTSDTQRNSPVKAGGNLKIKTKKNNNNNNKHPRFSSPS